MKLSLLEKIELCKINSLKYSTKKEFFLADRASYSYAYNHGFLNDICKHMNKLGDRKHKCVYAYEYLDNHVYVGITYNFFKRKLDRDCRCFDTVTEYTKKSGLIPIHKQLTDYINVDIAAKLEGMFVEKYRDDGWLILNRIKTGGVGGDTLYWTKDKCLETAKLFNTRSDFNLKSKGAYDSARRNGWLDECYAHMKILKKPYNSWTKKDCLDSASKHKSTNIWKLNDFSAWNGAYKNGWLDECKIAINNKNLQ